MHLTTNVRLHLRREINAEQFAYQLMSLLSNGEFPVDHITGLISLNLSNRIKSHRLPCERVILAPKDDSVRYVNKLIQEVLPYTSVTYTFIDSVMDILQVVHYPTEILNALEPTGIPHHTLSLKGSAGRIFYLFTLAANKRKTLCTLKLCPQVRWKYISRNSEILLQPDKILHNSPGTKKRRKLLPCKYFKYKTYYLAQHTL